MQIDLANLMQTFPVMGLGMLGIFVVMAIIYLLTWACTRVKPKGNPEE